VTAADRLRLRAAECACIAALLDEHAQPGAYLVQVRATALREAVAEIEGEAIAAPLLTAAPAGPAPPPPPEPAKAPPPAPDFAPEPDLGERYTPERRALLARIWGDMSLTSAQIFAEVNALPGPPVASEKALYQGVIKRCGLPGSRMAYADQLAAEAKRIATPPPPAPPPPTAETRPAPAPTPEPEPEPAAATGTDQAAAQALAMLREGYAPAVIAKRTGLSPGTLIVMAERAETEARALLRAAPMPSTDEISAMTGLPPARIRTLRTEIATRSAAA
jgi:hypothetical protein